MKTKKEREKTEKANPNRIRTLNLTLDRSTFDKEERRVHVSFMSEEPCYNWGVTEYMLATNDAADLTRFQNGVAPVLFNHDRDIVIGRIENISFENGKGYADVVFDKDEDSQKIMDKVESGSLRGTSVGYLRKKVVWVDEGENFEGRFEGPCEVVTRWELLEFSIVSIPADPEVGVGREIPVLEDTGENGEPVKDSDKFKERKENEKGCGDKPKKEEDPKGEEKPEEEENTKKENEKMEKDFNVEEAARAAVEAENARVKEITALCRKHNIDGVKMDSFIADTAMGVDKVRAAVLDILATQNKPVDVSVKVDEKDKVKELAVKGIASRYNLLSKEEKAEKADRETLKYAGLSLRSLTECCLENEGVTGLRFMGPTEVFERAMGSATFKGIMDEFSHKAMMKGYNEQAFIFDKLVSKGSNSDFKPNHQYQIGLDGEPVRMSEESGEFTYVDMADREVSTSIATYGKGVKLTREIFINDQLGQVSKIITAQSAGFRRLQEKQFFDMFTKTANFSAKNANLASTNKGVSIDALSEMERLMLEQKDFEEKGFIGVPPKYILAPTSRAAAIRQLIKSTSDPAATNSGVANIYQGAYEVLTSPYLTAKSADAYYMVADPSAIAGIEFTTLNGVDTPSSRTFNATETLGMVFQIYMDFGFNLLGVQGFVKNPGK